jgi:DNA topoisomerase IA
MGGEDFETKGLIVDHRNWLVVYTYEKWNTNALPMIRQDERFEPTKIDLSAGETRPPNGLTESDLLAKMVSMASKSPSLMRHL